MVHIKRLQENGADIVAIIGEISSELKKTLYAET
jgi:hypothetical protein